MPEAVGGRVEHLACAVLHIGGVGAVALAAAECCCVGAVASLALAGVDHACAAAYVHTAIGSFFGGGLGGHLWSFSR